MSPTFTPGVGGTLSADIAVPEHEREVRFYSRVLCTGENPLWREDLMNNLGQPIIGLGERIPEYSHLPLQWMPHVQVADVATSVKHALDLGGKELMHGKDDNGESQWAVLLDPNGAAFGILPVVSAEATSPTEGDATARSGHIAWLNLTVSDAAATRDFYTRVVGWSSQEIENEGGRSSEFHLLGGDGTPAAGIYHPHGASLPPIWLLSLPVGDFAESLRRVEEEGGQVLQAITGKDGKPAYAVIRDPVGAHFALTE